MRAFSTLTLALIICYTVSAQELVRERIADLRPLDYSITGNAILEEYDDGNLKLRLSDDFTTDRGPDVRVFLSNGATTDGAIEIANLATINHFSGAISFDVPGGVMLEDYNRVFFYCSLAMLPWADGALGAPITVDNGFECEGNATSALGGVDSLDICPSDELEDVITFENSLDAPVGDHYSYLLTDANGILQQVLTEATFNFEGTSLAEQRVYGVSYDGTLNPMIGVDRMQTTATGCIEHSDVATFLTITKNACQEVYECNESFTSTFTGLASVDVCPSDGEADIVTLNNSLSLATGTHYSYLLTDTNDVLLEVFNAGTYDFEGSGLEEQRIYGINYDGELNAVIGENRMQTSATECFTHSSETTFLTVTKNGCPPIFECQESLVATHNWVTEVDLCTTDGEIDTVFLQNNIDVDPGGHYVFLLTDTNEIVQEIIMDDIYDFEDTGTDEMRIYGLHYDGDLQPFIGETRKNTTATGCNIHSGDNIFITVNRTATCATSTVDRELAAEIIVYPNPTTDVIMIDLPERFQPTEVTLVSTLGQTMKTILIDSGANQFQLEVSGLPVGQYLLRLEDGQRLASKLITIVR
jgi:hypothetical protein